MKESVGIVIRGINNIYTVIHEEDISNLSNAAMYSCRIKGKILQNIDDVYNPLAVGDRVLFTVHQGNEGLIGSRVQRTNSFERWNAKRSVNQTLVANMDLILCISSADEPPFRPRFIDRAIVCAHQIPVMIILNKCDLMLTEEQLDRFNLYEKLGYEIFSLSAFDSDGITALRKRLLHKTVAMIGQSGVGKSTIVNGLVGDDIVQKTQDISQKFHRGRHTTNYAVMLDAHGFNVVDTPGMRELHIPHEDPHQIADCFPEFRIYRDKCGFQSCLHIHEPDCAIQNAVESGAIHSDRYESYVRMIASLEQRPESWESDRR